MEQTDADRGQDVIQGMQPSDRGRRVAGPVDDGAPSAGQLAQERATMPPPGHVGESHAAVTDKEVHRALPELTDDELRRLSVLDHDAALDQGGVYLDLDDLGTGPFTAMGGETAGERGRVISKQETDYLLWNRLTGRDTDGDGVPDGGAA